MRERSLEAAAVRLRHYALPFANAVLVAESVRLRSATRLSQSLSELRRPLASVSPLEPRPRCPRLVQAGGLGIREPTASRPKCKRIGAKGPGRIELTFRHARSPWRTPSVGSRLHDGPKKPADPGGGLLTKPDYRVYTEVWNGLRWVTPATLSPQRLPTLGVSLFWG